MTTRRDGPLRAGHTHVHTDTANPNTRAVYTHISLVDRGWQQILGTTHAHANTTSASCSLHDDDGHALSQGGEIDATRLLRAQQRHNDTRSIEVLVHAYVSMCVCCVRVQCYVVRNMPHAGRLEIYALQGRCRMCSRRVGMEGSIQ